MARAQIETTDKLTAPQQSRIGKYTLLERLGVGGMAIVHKVSDDHGALFALKELKSPGEMGRRFKKEFEVVRRIRHPNIVEMIECFEAQHTMHIVMEYVDGLDLRDVLSHYGKLSPGLVAFIGAEIASGLAFAHREGVLHRDLKPENVMVTRQGKVLVMDFGVARVLGSRMTTTGIIVGSPGYMSPEQLGGRGGQKLRPSSDIYSLATMLWELLEGEYPLAIKKDMELVEVLGKKLDGKLRPMRHCTHEGLGNLLRRCLDPDDMRRPELMDHVEGALREVVRESNFDWEQLRRVIESALSHKAHGTGRKKVRPGGPPATAKVAFGEAPSLEGAPRLVPGGARRGATRIDGARDDLHGGAPPPRMHSSERAAPAQAQGQVVPDPDSIRLTRTPRPPRVTEISVKTPTPEGHRAVTAAAILIFLAAAAFLGASAALTGSPLGLVERWIPLSAGPSAR